MKLAALGVFGVLVVGALSVGCSPLMTASARPKLQFDTWDEIQSGTAGEQVGSTSLTNATLVKGEPKKLLIPYVNFDDLDGQQDDDGSSDVNLVVQTWGAPYQAYEGYDPKLGF